jgi:hypothetical protein
MAFTLFRAPGGFAHMPYAEHADTAYRWATERGIACWVSFAGDLGERAVTALHAATAAIRADGARWVLVAPPGLETTDAERNFADVVVTGAAAPAPWGVFAALQAAASDVRRLGVIGATRAVLEAGHNAGVGAVIALAGPDHADRLPLLPAQPDAIITPREFASLDAERFGSGRAHRQRVLLNPGPLETEEGLSAPTWAVLPAPHSEGRLPPSVEGARGRRTGNEGFSGEQG